MLLHKHNRETYANMVSLFASNQRVAAVQPTGTGKSYLILQLIADNPNRQFAVCSPSTYIFGQMKSLADEYNISIENTEFVTYTKLAQTELITEFDYIVLDEFHRCGADEWGRGVQELLEANPDAKVFGTSATPIRYLDSGRNMADELFDGVYAVNMSLAEAIRRKILPLPVYVTSWYSFRGDIEQLEIKAEQSGNPRLKNALLGKIRKAKSMIAELDVGIEKVFEKHIPDKAGKFIVFCPNVESLQRMVSECDAWFTKVNRDIHKYTVYAQNSSSDKQFEEFRNDKDASALKLLFCIDMLNEGVHFDDIDGVIMLRATQSANVFYQQLGRALACSESNKHPVIFDIVNNFESGDTAQQYAGIMEIARGGEIYDDEIEFELYDYVRDIREILNELNDTFSNSWDFNFELLKEYVDKYDEFPCKNESYEGVSLGKWCVYQRVLNNRGKLPKAQVDKLNDIGFPWNVYEENWQAMFSKLSRLVEKLGCFPKKADYPQEDISLYRWVCMQKDKYRKGVLEPERAEMLIQLGCDMGLLWSSAWEQRYQQLCDFIAEHHRFPDNSDALNDTEIMVLYTWMNSQRTKMFRGTMEADRKALLDKINFPWDKRDEQWNKTFELLKKYYADHGSLPETSVTVDGVHIGVWYRAQFQLYQKGLLQSARLDRFNSANVPLTSPRSARKNGTWAKYYDSYMEYLTRYGHLPNSTERYKNLELRKWRSRQLKYKQLGKLTAEQVEQLRNICSDVAWVDHI